MASPENAGPASVSLRELRTFDDEQLARFMNECRVPSGGFDVSRIDGVMELSKQERNELADILDTAAKKAGPLNADALSSRLASIPARPDVTDQEPARAYDPARDTTETPPERDFNGEEAFYHDELVVARGRPVMSFQRLLDTFKDPPEDIRRDIDTWMPVYQGIAPIYHAPDDVPRIFREQLDDWYAFKYKWQWDNRGKYKSEEGFAEWDRTERRILAQHGQIHMAADPSDYAARSIWDSAARPLEVSGRKGFAAYAEALKARLTTHRFLHPFELAEDPRQQDAWTTWVEYLGYLYYWQDRCNAALTPGWQRYRENWEEIKSLYKSLPLLPELGKEAGAGEKFKYVEQKVDQFVEGTRNYHYQERVARAQEMRAKWALKELSVVSRASEQSATQAPDDATQHLDSLSDSSTSSSKRKRSRDDRDNPRRKKPKRAKQPIDNSPRTLSAPRKRSEQNNIDLSPDDGRTSTPRGSKDSRPRQADKSAKAERQNDPVSSSATKHKLNESTRTKQSRETALSTKIPETRKPKKTNAAVTAVAKREDKKASQKTDTGLRRSSRLKQAGRT